MKIDDAYYLQQMGIDVWEPYPKKPSFISQLTCAHQVCAETTLQTPDLIVILYQKDAPFFSSLDEYHQNRMIRCLLNACDQGSEQTTPFLLTDEPNNAHNLCIQALQEYLMFYASVPSILICKGICSQELIQRFPFFVSHPECTPVIADYDELLVKWPLKKALMHQLWPVIHRVE